MTFSNNLSNVEEFNNNNNRNSNIFSSQSPNLPQIGQTRCYWMLLTPSLHFLALDPVLHFHLQEQASSIIGKPLLDFVHPEEQASAKYDLKCVLQDNTLHGSVTRVRYSRLSRVRRILGYVPSASTPPYPPTFPAERVAYDDNYMAVDIVINWATDGVVLCFIHAAVDIVPTEDNDESNKNGWTNWCGTYGFDERQVQVFNDCLQTSVPPLQIPRSAAESSHRVFQLLRNEPERPLLLTWPPDSHFQQNRYRISPSSQSLATLAHDVQINTNDGTNLNINATTSCTRRFKSLQTISVPTNEESKLVSVESIYIPHGSVIFACHKIDPCVGLGEMYDTPLRSNHYPTFSSAPGHYLPATHAQEFSDVSAAAYDLQYLGASHHPHSQHYANQWIEEQSIQHPPQPWAYGMSPDDPSMSPNVRVRSVNGHSYHGGWGHQSLPYVDSNLGSGPQIRSHPPAYGAFVQGPTSTTHATSSMLSAADGTDSSSTSTSETRTSIPSRRRSPGIGRDSTGGGGRGSGNPPAGIMRCASCKATQSPEWRKGPNGKKELCNACGLRFARSRAKKEGVAPRRRKDKATKSGSAGSELGEVSSDESRQMYGRSLAPVSRRHEYEPSIGSFSDAFDTSSGNVRPAHLQSSDRYGFHLASPSPSPPLSNGHFGAAGNAQFSSGSYYSLPPYPSDYGALHHAALAPVSINGTRIDSHFTGRSLNNGRDDFKDKSKLDFDKDRMLPLSLETSRSADFRFLPIGKGANMVHEVDFKKSREKADLVW